MMNKNYIWDLDGTLFDSYRGIVETAYILAKENGFEFSKDEIYKQVVGDSVTSYIEKLSELTNKPYKELKSRYSKIRKEIEKDLTSIDGACEVLEELSSRGAKHYVYTHRGDTSYPLLKRLDMDKFFEEIITAEDGFKRKPDPEALTYLLDKYDMDKNQTYYVGDRHLDVECAKNAGIKAIFYIAEESFLESRGQEDILVYKLKDILKFDE